MIIKEYPKTVTLTDDTEVVLRLMKSEDKPKLLKFLSGLPREDRLFLKYDVTDPRFIDIWLSECDNERAFTILAERDGEIIGEANLHRSRYAWAKHVGEIRLLVSPDFRRRGLGTILSSEVFHQCLRLGLDKIQVLVMSNQIGALKAFKKLGFKKEAELKDHVMDLEGNKHNLVILTNHIRKLVDKIDDMIRSMELTIEDRVPE